MRRVSYLIILFVSLFCFSLNVEGATKDYTISVSASTVTKGSRVTLYLKGSNATGSFQVSSSDNTVLSGGDIAWVENNTVKIVFESLKAGSATIIVKPIDVANSENASAITESKSIKVTVKNPAPVVKKSNDASLSSLSVVGSELQFNKDTLEYNIELAYGVTSIKVEAIPNSNVASVSGTGDISVQTGNNNIDIVVTAEDGTKKTYTVHVNVLDLPAINVSIEEGEYTLIRKKEELPSVDYFDDYFVTISNEQIPAYYNENLKLYLVGLKDKDGNSDLYIYDIEEDNYIEYSPLYVGLITLYLKEPTNIIEGYSSYNIDIEGVNTKIWKLDKEAEFGLIYGINMGSNEEGYYVYDIKEGTLQRYYTEEIDIYKKKANQYFILSMLSISILVITVIGGIVLSFRKKCKKR